MQDKITDYITELNRLYCAGNAMEHTYRPALLQLLEDLTSSDHQTSGDHQASGLTITNEPKRIACGAPDYIITRGVRPLGYVEAKDIGENLNDKKHKEQFDRYKQSLDNLIITDYLTFQLFEAGEPVTSVTIAHVTPNGIEAEPSQFKAFDTLIWRFVGYEGLGIETSEQLAKVLANKTRFLASVIENALNGEQNGDVNTLEGQLKGFRDVLIHDISHKEFPIPARRRAGYRMRFEKR